MTLPHGWYYWFFAMNALFAWIPFILSDLIWREWQKRGYFSWQSWIAYVIVILFLPNTFYIVTDFVHLDPGQSFIVWFDVLLTGAFTWLGMLYGFITVRKMQLIVAEMHGVMLGWVAAGILFVLSSAGIYFGRVARYYSWDILVNPIGFAKYLLINLPSPSVEAQFWAFVAGFVLLLGTIYLAIFGRSGSNR